MSMKAGKRHSAKDQKAIQDIHDQALALGAACEGEELSEEETKALSRDLQVDAVRQALWRACRDLRGTYANWDDVPYTPLNIYDDHAIVRLGNAYYQVAYTITDESVVLAPRDQWVQVEQTWEPSLAVKSLGADRVAGYLVLFGSPDTPDLSSARDFFTKSTDFWLEKWPVRPMLYHHAMELPADFEPVIGSWTKTLIDDVGVWGEGELDKSHKYKKMIKKLLGEEALASSSDSAPHLVRRRPAAKGTNEVIRWPLAASSLTPTPAEPRLLPVATIKAAYKAIGLDISLDAEGETSTASATGATAQDDERAAREAAIKSLITTLEDKPMEFKTAQECLTAAKTALATGDLEQAEKLTKMAQAFKTIESMEAKAEVPATAPAATKTADRLPFAHPDAATGQPEPTSEVPFEIKAWGIKKFGNNLENGVDQVCKELYGRDYVHVAWAKNADYRRYIRSGHYDPTLARVVLLTPDQVVSAVADGVTVGEIKATMVEAQGELGGYLAPEDQRLEMVQRLPGMTVVRKRARVITTKSNSVTFPKVRGGDNRYIGAARVYLVDESPTASQSNTNALFGQLTIPIHTIMAHVDLTRNLLEDSGIDLVAYLGDELTPAHAIFEDELFLIGLGVMGPQGILNGPTGAPHNADVIIKASGHASQLTGDGVVKMPTGLAKQYRNNGSIWVCNKTTRENLDTLKDLQNRYLFASNDKQLASAQEERLRGYVIEESEAMPDIAANTYPIIFGDFAGYTIADRIGMEVQRYEDSTTAVNNSVRVVARRRLGGQVMQGYRFVAMKVAASL